MSATTHRLTAMKDAGVAISVVHIDRKYIVFDGGMKLKIRLFDEFDNEVSDPEDATWYEFGSDELGWGSAPFKLAEFKEFSH